jgi:hypothetical protein
MQYDARSARIAHVLFLDMVGFSRETMQAQGRLLEQLNTVVTATAAYGDALTRNAALPVPSGDGMALLFFDDVTAPARCAVEVARALRAAGSAALPLRMGLHSGLVQKQIDISGKENVVGEGINTAQRVMDFGDGGHILLSAQYASWLAEFEEWRTQVIPLGEGVAKHGLRVSLFALRGADYGRADPPASLGGTVALPDAHAAEAPVKVALLYKSDGKNGSHDRASEKVLAFLEERLRADGLDVFLDRARKINLQWVQTVEERIRETDAVIAIVSPQSLQSEMLVFELETAHDQQQKTGKPLILPVSIGLSREEFDGPLAAITAPLPHFHWDGPGDDQRLAAELLSAIREPLKPRPEEVRLEPVGGAVPPDSPFYVERACDGELMAALDARESILLIKGPRQVGKTSLEARGVQWARARSRRVGITDFQKLGTPQMASDDLLYRLLAATLARQLRFRFDFEAEWDPIFGANLNMETFLRELLDASDEPLIWFMDEVDKLFAAPFASDFFGLVRSWHNSRSTEPGGPWDKLTVVIAYATEAHLFIQDLNQSPFNVGRRLDLEDFNLQQTIDLSGRYGGPLRSYQEVEELHALIGGQPVLTRKALDVLATGKLDYVGLIAEADRDDGPFGDHLKRILVSVSRLPQVAAYVRAVLFMDEIALRADQDSYYRLLAAGVIRQGWDGRVAFRCELYRRYLGGHLGA